VTSKENLLRVLHHDNPDWVPNGMESVTMIGSPVVERPGFAGLDDFGVEWDYEEGAQGGTFPAAEGNTISDLSGWREQITIPDIDVIDWTEVKEASEAIDRKQSLVCGFVEMGLFERTYLLLGMEDALVAFLQEPQILYDLVGAVADYKIALIEKFDDAADLDIVWYGDDWGSQENLFMPPDTWREIIKPHTKRIYDSMKRRSIIVNQHSCGKIESIFADMVGMGADIWNPCQPCNDLADLKKEYGGMISFCGGIDSQFVLDRPGVTTEEVREEVRRRINEMAAGGGYIASPSHSVPFDKELIDAMNDEITIYGRGVYQ
jgi:uroporphyrinogen-III decarboxylase